MSNHPFVQAIMNYLSAAYEIIPAPGYSRVSRSNILTNENIAAGVIEARQTGATQDLAAGAPCPTGSLVTKHSRTGAKRRKVSYCKYNGRTKLSNYLNISEAQPGQVSHIHQVWLE
jgi:hypothetical protein